jgi:hypothetical protein
LLADGHAIQRRDVEHLDRFANGFLLGIGHDRPEVLCAAADGSPGHLAPLALPVASVCHRLRIVLAFLHEAILRRSAERFAVAANRFWLT